MASCDSCASQSCPSAQQGAGVQPEVVDPLARRLGSIRHKIVVMSGKGGVGKSTTAVNLALALAAKGNRVGLLDIDIHGPSLPKMFGVEGVRPEVCEDGIMPVRAAGIKLMSMGFFLMTTGDATILRGPMKSGTIQQFIQDVVWGDLDYLVLDCPPGTGDEPISAVRLLGEGSAAVVVTTPQDVALTDVEKSLNFCREMKMPVVGLVENMSGFICPHCGERSELFKSGGAALLAQKMGCALLASIPFEPQVVIGGDGGEPHLLAFPDSINSQAYRAIASAVKDYCAATTATANGQVALNA
ncbi:MAG: ATP-binding protein [Desulfuromonas sp.]|nr:MAG: ATP-binding protein [Desulfuromonas sp.]